MEIRNGFLPCGVPGNLRYGFRARMKLFRAPLVRDCESTERVGAEEITMELTRDCFAWRFGMNSKPL